MASSPILMPKLGLTMTEGLLAEWRVRPGEQVRAGEVIFAVETDKITSEVEARGDGRIEEIKVQVGETVPVGTVIATWSGPAHGVDGPEAETASPDSPASHGRVPGSGLAGDVGEEKRVSRLPLAGENKVPRIIATPYARKLAREAGLALEPIKGTGPHGRIKAADVAAALEAAPTASTRPAALSFALALSEVDCTAALSLCQRLAEAGEAFSLADLVARAAARSGHQLALAPASGGTAWLLPQATGDRATLALGPVQPQFRPDAVGNPVLRQIAPMALAAQPCLDAATILDGIVHSLESPLRLLL